MPTHENLLRLCHSRAFKFSRLAGLHLFERLLFFWGKIWSWWSKNLERSKNAFFWNCNLHFWRCARNQKCCFNLYLNKFMWVSTYSCKHFWAFITCTLKLCHLHNILQFPLKNSRKAKNSGWEATYINILLGWWFFLQ